VSDLSAPTSEDWRNALAAARAAIAQAASDTALAADELRRYQKFAKPGRPSAHIVQLRQKQAGARQASARAKQAFLKAAVAFTRQAGLTPPPGVTLEAYMLAWLDEHA
jgi:multidrug resistance efflux pump